MKYSKFTEFYRPYFFTGRVYEPTASPLPHHMCPRKNDGGIVIGVILIFDANWKSYLLTVSLAIAKLVIVGQEEYYDKKNRIKK